MYMLISMIHFFSLKFAFCFMVVQGILGIELSGANGAGIGENIGEVNCFNMVPHTCGCFVWELETYPTSWNVLIVSDHVQIQIWGGFRSGAGQWVSRS